MEPTNYFDLSFVQLLIQKHFPANLITVREVKPLEVDNSASILVALTAGTTEKEIGHFGLAVTYEKDGTAVKRNMVMKVKPHGDAIVEMLSSLATACGTEVGEVYNAFKKETGFQFTHLKEQEIHSKIPSQLTPEIFGLYSDPAANSYIILMEYLQEVKLLNSVMRVEEWTDGHIKAALHDIAEWHAQNLNSKNMLNRELWPDKPCANYMERLSPLWKQLLENAATRFPDLYTKDRQQKLRYAIENISLYWRELEQHPKTLIHNDFNPRNTCFKDGSGGLNLCAYDWELATFHLPQYDIVEFLSFVLDEDRYHLRKEYLEYYRKQLNNYSGLFEDKLKFEQGFYLAAFDFGLHRLGMYMMAHSVSAYPFLPRVVKSYFDLLNEFDYESFFSKSTYVAET